MGATLEAEWLEVFTEAEVEELRKQADGDTARPAPVYLPTPADLDAQAAADRDQEQAERDYRELARLVVRVLACRCGQAECLTCRVGKWLTAGL
jgi:hypothetical protein